MADSAAGGDTDVGLLVQLLVLYTDAERCADTTDDVADRAAFRALGDGLERLIVTRGGAVVTPRAGVEFDPRLMEVADTRPTADPELVRRVAETVGPGLRVGGRAIRPALVVVYRAAVDEGSG